MSEKTQILAEQLATMGLQHAFGVTGSGLSWALITDLEERGVHFHPVAHEASAALMAGAVTRGSSAVSASISIKGPGLANMLPGIIANYYEGYPAVSIAEAYSHDAPSHQKHKRLDHPMLLSSVVKDIAYLSDPPDRISDIIRLANQEVPGPVHLELCEAARPPDLLKRGIDESPPPIWSGNNGKFLATIQASQRPILIVGSLALRRTWGSMIGTLKIPIFTTVAAKGVLNEGLPCSVGVFTGAGKRLSPEFDIFSRADLVVGIGLRNTEVLRAKSFGKMLIILDEIDQALSLGFEPDILLIDPGPGVVLEAIAELQEKDWGLDIVQHLLESMRTELLNTRWLPAASYYLLNNLDGPYALVLDTGLFCTVGEHLWLAGQDRFYMGSSNSRYMGVALPSAIGLAICRPELPVFCVTGDGGIRMYLSEIKIAIERALPICFILMSDGQYGSIASVDQLRPRSRHAVAITNPSWANSIAEMGCDAYRVESTDSFASAIQNWDRSQPRFVEAIFDPGPYTSMTEALR